MSRRGRPAARLALAALVLSLSGCGHKTEPSAAKTRGLSDWLAECSPFSPADAGKALIFDYDGSVVLDRGDNPKAWDLTGAEHLAGRWSGEEGGSTLQLNLPGKPPARYLLQHLAGRTCLLTDGPSPVIDVRKIWFGFVRDPDGEDDEQDP